MAIRGIMDVLTKTLPSLAVAPATVCLLPSNKTNVEDKPKPLKFILDVPCVAPEVNESGTFSDPLFEARFLVRSATVFTPKFSIDSRSITSTGEAPSVGLVFKYEPVTTISSIS